MKSNEVFCCALTVATVGTCLSIGFVGPVSGALTFLATSGNHTTTGLVWLGSSMAGVFASVGASLAIAGKADNADNKENQALNLSSLA